ncbi:MAG: bifunctional (p)ppGpp synthetase/guanosine-3',5'-bis(diphosphate) 3'-pyrophosphohydrolase [Hydrogenovibrio crunogenus]|uniref:GTP pyrophosphokinase n=1 Tax=Hydrogenovibrio crunogenus (strain DSM 25203 / XCL-2) TaxID=317025 RepID=Q31GB6_HYDCU|nr:bifunctional (p)ppGpp synthetase/guanosine-3',5'-bis(diphosphate) 3'-pyrophosphohydrolase [Hydrogenovibrio crunogenus]
MDSAQTLYQTIFKTDEPDPLALQACQMALEAEKEEHKGLVRSIDAAIILSDLKLDRDTLIATLISDMGLEQRYPIEKISDEFGDHIAQMVTGVRRLNHFKEFHPATTSNEVQTERLRQMLLAMTSDIRIMIVKLAFRVARLRTLKNEPEAIRQQIASETQMIFAPLANRLGIAQLKWELEDLSFRFLQPDTYKEVARQLDAKRHGRETYIQGIIQSLEEMLKDSGIEHHISGRPKHIYSIWKKMTRKNVPIDELFDLRAVRIYVDTVQQCYEVLGMIHSRWPYIKDEFDDYIANPKENGYQSIHTVIIGAENKTVEIQIRTHEMHRHAEFGVAAHWRYKEGGKSIDPALEQSINLVRQMLEYNDNPDLLNEISTELLTEHIYVMTPKNEIITMSKGSTPLDFAYQIHSELGHRCRGAKINGKIMPLTYQLNTGDTVEILSVKGGTPNRNWLNPNLHYLGSSRSRAKVRHWFNQQNKEANTESGESLFNKEARRLHAEHISAQEVAERFKYEQLDEFYEALGKGQINERQLTNAIQKLIKPEEDKPQARPPSFPPEEQTEPGKAFVIGAPRLKTTIAPCCEPTENDQIVGYVTRGRGVTIHKKECANILNLTFEEQKRLIEVAWYNAEPQGTTYEATLQILAFDRKGLLRDIMMELTQWDINVNNSDTRTDKSDGSVSMTLDVDVEPHTNMGELLDQLEQIQNVVSTSVNLNKQQAS